MFTGGHPCTVVCPEAGPRLDKSAAHRLVLVYTGWNRRGGEEAIPTIFIPSPSTWVTRGFTRSRSEAVERTMADAPSLLTRTGVQGEGRSSSWTDGEGE